MIVLLAYFLGRVTYTKWQTFEDVSTAKMAVELLDEAGIAYKVAADGVTVSVDSKRVIDATYAITDSSLLEDGLMSLEEMLNSDISTTNYEKQVKFSRYTLDDLAKQIEGVVGVEKARLNAIPVDRTTTILAESTEMQCTVFLTINKDFTKTMAESIAVGVSNALGNSSLESVKVIDQYGNLLYNGPEDEDVMSLSNQMAQTEATYEFYRDLVVRYGLHLNYDYVEAEFNLDINYDRIEEYLHEYLPAEGSDQGLLSVYEKYSAENSGSTEDVPGTDSNDETDYYIETSTAGKSSVDSEKMTYIPSERVTTTLKQFGVIDTENSSGAIILKRVRQYTERELEVLGLLEETTYEEYKINNSQPVQQETPQEFYDAFSKATGIDAENLQIIIYEIPEYLDPEEVGTDWNLIWTIVLFVVIILLLIFVVFRVSKPVEVIETEPELSVEKLLATTKENQSLDDIEFSEKSEVRKMIEKFVDENPEAVAALLRNWLNDEWS
ncbi:MAG: hypothetical protein IJY09_11500 [Lachnospiraceae bacterium]|nr:hypothetical protein [Lachnospiraceae bacterium]